MAYAGWFQPGSCGWRARALSPIGAGPSETRSRLRSAWSRDRLEDMIRGYCPRSQSKRTNAQATGNGARNDCGSDDQWRICRSIRLMRSHADQITGIALFHGSADTPRTLGYLRLSLGSRNSNGLSGNATKPEMPRYNAGA